MERRHNQEDGSKKATDTEGVTKQYDTEGLSTTESDNSDNLSPAASATNCVQESNASSRNNSKEERNDNGRGYLQDCEHKLEQKSTVQSRHDSHFEPRRGRGYSDVNPQDFSDCELVEDSNNSSKNQRLFNKCVQETCGLERHPGNISDNGSLQETNNSSVQSQYLSVDGNSQQALTIAEHLRESEMTQPQSICITEYRQKTGNSVEQSRTVPCTEYLQRMYSDVSEFQTKPDTKCEKELYLDIKSSTDVFCSVSKRFKAKLYRKLLLNFFLHQTGAQSEFSANKKQIDSKHDLDRYTFVKKYLQELVTLPVQDFFYDSLIYTVLPVSRTPVTSEQQSTSNSSSFSGFDPLLTVINNIAEGERVPPQITMRYEMLRFCTLRSFPKENKPFITRLAGAGFYYANSGDEVVCYCCARRKSNWTESDNPMEIHRQMNPNCSFLTRNSEVNIPIRQVTESSSAVFTSSTRSSTSGTHLESSPRSSYQNNLETTVRNHASVVSASNSDVNRDSTESDVTSIPNTTTVTGIQTQISETSSTIAATSVTLSRQTNQSLSVLSVDVPGARSEHRFTNSSLGGINSQDSPKYPKYYSKTVRLTSFVDCGDIVITPENLAEAGFFYAGFGDCVRCFQCGVGLRHWSEEDDPWIEHSRWSKECSYVRQMRGQEFVNLVQMAVQYSQNQNGDDLLSQDTSGAAGGQSDLDQAGTDRLMHTDAAQSVLEMGYNPDVIRRAIRMIISSAGLGSLTAANLMEKIFEIEDSETPQNTILDGTETSQGRQQDEHPHRTSTVEARNTTEEASMLLNSQREHSEGTESREAIGGNSRSITDKEENQKPDDTTPTSREGEFASGYQDSGSNQSNTIQNSQMDKPATARKAHLLEQKRLKEENEKLKQQSICTKCKTNDVCIVFLPCGHLVTCEECAPTVRYCTVDTCGKYIKGTVRTYLA
ncbi:baculoviral IAP repeat-containing protein 3-like [Mercenaria mercenaria]|uniref:baculoviral IAP repeat-containing protein 3-like n=1 Tax=Mercenaria mercenaria TaxID=6596 RepID=UPI00234F37E0|nr:baculoviral IAP repeat-containing protein 3-like [Mercenaria mercenaria]